jgi:predicted aminopeptidase
MAERGMGKWINEIRDEREEVTAKQTLFSLFPFFPFSLLPSPLSLVSLLGVALCLAACSPTYVLRAGYEEAKILWHRRPITEVLARPNLDAATRQKLEMVLRVRQFVEYDLGFTTGGSYQTVTEIAKPPIVYVVTAVPRTKLEPYTWWFPIIGSVAYKGYFDQGEAKQEAQKLEAQGYDTYIRAASAFSTLGWFSDPLLPHLLKYDEETLTNIVIHELFHTTFYVKGESAFNESLANFTGHRGVIAFLTKEQGRESTDTRRAIMTWENELAVANFFADAANRLNALYNSMLSEEEKLCQREQLFALVQEEFRRLPATVRRNANLAKVKLNNAVILQYRVYLQDLALFERVYQQNGQDLRTTLEKITQAARNSDDPFAATLALVGEIDPSSQSGEF